MGEFKEAQEAMTRDIEAAIRSEYVSRAEYVDMVSQVEAVRVGTEAAGKQVGILEGHYEYMRASLERESQDLSKKCYNSHNEVADMKQRLQRENRALGDELSRVRAAATSLTHAVLKAFQILGLL